MRSTRSVSTRVLRNGRATPRRRRHRPRRHRSNPASTKTTPSTSRDEAPSGEKQSPPGEHGGNFSSTSDGAASWSSSSSSSPSPSDDEDLVSSNDAEDRIISAEKQVASWTEDAIVQDDLANAEGNKGAAGNNFAHWRAALYEKLSQTLKKQTDDVGKASAGADSEGAPPPAGESKGGAALSAPSSEETGTGKGRGTRTPAKRAKREERRRSARRSGGGDRSSDATASTALVADVARNNRRRKRTANDNYCPRSDRKKRARLSAHFTTREFETLWQAVAESRFDTTTDEIEASSAFRGANNTDQRTVLSTVQTRAQYGRTLSAGMEAIIAMTGLKPSEVFLDIGHGIGSACLQAAYTAGCEARGVEVVSERCRVAEEFREGLAESAARKRGEPRQIGDVDLREGSLTHPDLRKFMASADVVLVNNADGVFGARSGGGTGGRPTLDAHVGGILAMLKPGSRMVTFDPLLCLGRSADEENERRSRAGLEESSDASFFAVERRSIGTDAVSWCETKEVMVYLYRRIRQAGSMGTGQALFLCSNKQCWGNSVGTSALDENTGLLVEECVYCGTKRTVKTRR